MIEELNQHGSAETSELDALLSDNWERMLSASAASIAARGAAAKRWEDRLATVRYAAIVVGAFLLIQFPFACYALESMESATAEYCASIELDK